MSDLAEDLTEQPVTAEQIIGHLAVKIQNTDLAMDVLADELTVLSRRPRSFEVNSKIMEMAKCATRRKTLIELWEFATNRRWADD